MDKVTTVSNITIQERRSAEGLDAHIPMILRDGELYDPDLDRFFLDLPLNGIRSRHSLRAYGYDVLVWVRFLSEACRKTVWLADPPDVLTYHGVRRRTEAGQRISAASWNRAVACLDRLYRWGTREGLIAEAPFSHRFVWRQAHGGRRAQVGARNEAYEPAARRADVNFVTLEDYRIFRDVGLKGHLPEGGPRPVARDRNGIRNALFSDLLVTTGMSASLPIASSIRARLCLKQATSADDTAPLTALCQPTRCPNACITAKHRPAWARARQEAKSFLSEKRLSPLQRATLDQDLARAEVVLDNIDSASRGGREE